MSFFIKNIELQLYKYGWKGVLLDSYPDFFGHPITLDIQTWVYPEAGKSAPSIDIKHIRLAENILEEIVALKPVLEEEFKSYQQIMEYDNWKDTIQSPKILLSNEDLDESETKWSFIVERSDWEDFGIHLEFEGTHFIESWSAD